MTTLTDCLDLPYERRLVFGLVADIESYPHFVPHIAAAHIRRRDGNELDVDQVVRLRRLLLPFRTHARLDPPSRIRIVGSDSLLGEFAEDWAFEDGPRGGTRLRCTTQFHIRSGLLNRLVGPALAEIHRATMQAFAGRARVVFRKEDVLF